MEKTYKNMCVLLIAMFAAFLGAYMYFSTPSIYGDGYEYVIQTEAWRNHASMDIREEDFLTAATSFGDNIAEAARHWVNGGNYQAKDGRIFAAHFGIYAAFTLPIKFLLKILNINQLRCFMITNAFLWVVALCTVFLHMKTSFKKRFFLLLFLTVHPAVFYVTWPHTEIFSYAFTIMGLVMFYNKKYKVSIFFVSVAAMQNIGLVFLGMVIGLDYWRSIIQDSIKMDCNKKISWKITIKNLFTNYRFDIVKTGICYMPCFLPIIHTFINFGKLNLVASVARENKYILEKGIAYWMDLNLGILPYMPVIVAWFIFQLFWLIKKQSWMAFLHILCITGIYYVLANQRQINSDMAGMMRYNVWVTPILLFLIINTTDNFDKNKLYNIFCILSVTITMAMICLAVGLPDSYSGIYSRLDFAPWSKIVLKYVPEIYNPYHGIFLSRTLGEEIYDANESVVYMDNEGYARKILIVNGDASSLKVFGDETSKYYWDSQVDELSKSKEYQYISIPNSTNIEIFNPLAEFRATEWPAYKGHTLIKGVYLNEGEICWTDSSVILGMSSDIFDGRSMKIVYSYTDIVKKYSEQGWLKVYINGKLVSTVDLDSVPTDQFQELIIPDIALPEDCDEAFRLEMITNVQLNPFHEGLSRDKRNLSLQLKYIGVKE